MFCCHSVFLTQFFSLEFMSNFRLKISSVKLSDSGNYSCMPTQAEGASVMVHVINGECYPTEIFTFLHFSLLLSFCLSITLPKNSHGKRIELQLKFETKRTVRKQKETGKKQTSNTNTKIEWKGEISTAPFFLMRETLLRKKHTHCRKQSFINFRLIHFMQRTLETRTRTFTVQSSIRIESFRVAMFAACKRVCLWADDVVPCLLLIV